MSLYSEIKNFLKYKKTMFTTPSHDGTGFVIPDYENFLGRKFLSYDLSEYDGLDNLSSPSGIIKSAQENCAAVLKVKNLFFLINGSSSGIIASMLSCLKKDDRVLIARNCHKSVYNGLVLTGAKPYWIIPEFSEEWGIYGKITPETVNAALNKYSKIKALIITSPTYYGICSDIGKISEICRKNGVILIVDEAHGGLKQFLNLYNNYNAVLQGADIAVQSLHKNCGAPNPCAVLIMGENSLISPADVQNSLNLINTTSPSYPLMMAVDSALNFLSSKNGKEKVNELFFNIEIFKKNISSVSDIKILQNDDFSKIVVKTDNLTGYDLSEILYDDFNIEDELANEKSVMFLCGLGTSKFKLKKLENALKKIVYRNEKSFKTIKPYYFTIPEIRITPANAYGNKLKYIDVQKSFGKTCGEVVSECPPEVPVLLPGEIIRECHISYMLNKMNKSLIGVIG